MERLASEQEGGWTPDFEAFLRGFISAARVSHTAWESAAATGVLQKTDFQLVLELSEVYAMQGRYEARALTVGEVIYAAIFEGGTRSISRNYRNLAGIGVSLS